ncbi:MAG: dockerin type I domain-containing protein [Planctomycetota bacterium]
MKRQRIQNRSNVGRRLRLESLESRRVLAAISVAVDGADTVSEVGSQTLRYTLTRDDAAFPMAVQVEFSGTAVYETDYQVRERDRDSVRLPESADADGTVRGTVIFEQGVDSLDVIVDPINDGVTELDETIVLSVLESDQFASISGAASRIIPDTPTEYFVVDTSNRLGVVDVERGVIDFVGFINASQLITDIAFTADGELYAISQDNLYQLRLDILNEGVIGTVFLGGHSIIGANALVDARDGDFGSTEGDLFAVGLGSLDLHLIDLVNVGGAPTLANVVPVFDIGAALDARAFPSNYLSSGDLDYRTGGELLLSVMRPEDPSDSLIEIETPGANGFLDRGPSAIEDTGEDFVAVQGFAFDNGDSYAFTDHTLLSFNPFNRDFARETELTGRLYTIGAADSATGVIEGIIPPPPTVALNSLASDPSDLPRGVQPTRWITQRSQISEIVVQLGFPIEVIPDGAITLTNLGITDEQSDVGISLSADQLVLSSDGQQITIQMTPEQLDAGRYQLEISSQVTFGDDFTFVGDSINRFFVLPGDFDGNNSVDLRDLDTLAYWMAEPTAPRYVDLDGVGTITTQDAEVLEANFAAQIELPDADEIPGEFLDTDRLAAALVTLGHRTDVNGSGAISPIDALIAINRIARGTAELNDWRYDTNRDGRVTPVDALRVINELAASLRGEGEGGFLSAASTSNAAATDQVLTALDNQGDFSALF